MATFTTDEKVAILLKKYFGRINTDVDLAFFSEPATNARPSVFENQILSQSIPSTRPTDGWNTGVSDTTFTNAVSGMSPGDTLNHSTHPIQYVHKLTLTQITAGNNSAYQGTSGGANLLSKSIPSSFDPAGGYGMTLFRNDGSTQVFDGEGEWVIDNDGGSLSFMHYEDVNGYISAQSPPVLSFFRYTGNVGLSSVSSLWTDGTNEIYPNDLNKTVCIGRNTTSTLNTYDLEVNGASKFHSSVECEEILAISDQRLKKNIEVIKDPIRIIKGLKGVNYRWKHNNEPSTGLLAQNVARTLPHSVNVSQDSKLMSVKYNHVVGVLVEAVKKQQSQIDSLLSTIQKNELDSNPALSATATTTNEKKKKEIT